MTTSRRRLLAAGLLASLLGPSFTAVAEGARADTHLCTDQFCHCATGRAAAPARPAPCHEGPAAPEPDCQMSARCHHDNAATPATPEPALTNESRALGDPRPPAMRALALAGAAKTGFSRIDSPPPRRA